MSTEINIEHAQVTITLDINGKVHLVAMDKDNLEAVSVLIKHSASHVFATNRYQHELVRFLRQFDHKDGETE